MIRKSILFGILMTAGMAASGAQHGGGMMDMQERMQGMDATMKQIHKADEPGKRMELMRQHMKEMHEAMGQMNEMMGGREHMMKQMGGGMMKGKKGQAGMMGGNMMNKGSGDGGMGMTPEMMQKRMDMMQMMMGQMLKHQQEYESNSNR